MKTIAVVVTFNRKELLKECLRSLGSQSVPVDTILVVDNASTDGTEELFADGSEFSVEPYVYHHMDQNTGGSGGFNEGIKTAYKMGCDWIWIMDDDVIPKSNCLEEFYNAIPVIKEPVSFLASAVFFPDGSVTNVPHPCYEKTDNGYPDWYRYLDNGIARIDRASFVSLLINWEAVDKCGYPVKDYFIWGDDSEYTQRITRNYGRAYMCGKSQVTHMRNVYKAIAIENEDNPNRLKNYYYCYRNLLINAHEYNKGSLSVISCIVKWNIRCFKILCNKEDKIRWQKVKIFHKGIWGYLLGKYDKEAFKNRLTIR